MKFIFFTILLIFLSSWTNAVRGHGSNRALSLKDQHRALNDLEKILAELQENGLFAEELHQFVMGMSCKKYLVVYLDF